MEQTLLIVDDEENILRSLKRLLHSDGYRILTANRGKEALELIEKHKVAVIVSDQRMPEMSGIELINKAKELHPDLVCLLLSGYTEHRFVQDAKTKKNIYRFLSKPWDDEVLCTAISEAFIQYESGPGCETKHMIEN